MEYINTEYKNDLIADQNVKSNPSVIEILFTHIFLLCHISNNTMGKYKSPGHERVPFFSLFVSRICM